MTENAVEIFTDGACSGNPGPGGWGAIVRYGHHEKVLYGFEPDTTNNRMELQAAIEGLKALKKPCDVVLYTDSQYVKQGITLWIHNWKKNHWRNASKQPVKNQDLWQALEKATCQHQVVWQWVKGHNGHEDNERADALARRAIEENT